MPTSNSPSARKNAAKQTNPARMRLLLALEPNCECGEPARIRRPKHNGTGGYESLCLSCLVGFDVEAHLEALHELLDSIEVD